ncbi:hypothetical protein [Halopseudomonas aestusnigri]|uniref:hypothetical protein n=1 Tax=Halopseudomonas aestusnigri TaxID=857252 RepID=UPI0028C2DA11|nr:hypothetical protein YSKK_13260 [Halopseudomonas aestusnigri]
MDAYGIGAGISGAAQTYLQAARRTGRTTAMLESLKDGDRVLCDSEREAARLRRLIKERGLRVEVLAVSPSQPMVAFQRGTPSGRTVFDHSWVEQFYLNAVESARRDLLSLETELSGYGGEHVKTRLQAEEISKWRWSEHDKN